MPPTDKCFGVYTREDLHKADISSDNLHTCLWQTLTCAFFEKNENVNDDDLLIRIEEERNFV